MSVYCNVEECGNWIELQEKVRQPRGRGYIPIGDIGLYNGQCSLNRIDIEHKEFRGSGGSRHKLALCTNFSKEKGEVGKDFLQVTCTENTCRFNNADSGCDQLEWEKDIYIDIALASDKNDQVAVPACKSYILRNREGFMSVSKFVT